MTTGFAIEVDQNAAAAAQEAAEQQKGGDGFPPLPGGKYQAYVEKFLKVEDFAKSGPNAGKKVARFQIKIRDDSPNGAKRVYFLRVPLFTRYAPSEKNPQGAPATMFWDFFEKVAGASREQLLAGQTPGPNEIGGKPLTITLSAPIKPDSYNPKGSNEITYVDAPGDIAATPTNKVFVPWLDDNGNVKPGWGPDAQQAAPAAQQATPPAYNPGAQQQPPAWNPQQQAAQPPAWLPSQQQVQQAVAAATTGY